MNMQARLEQALRDSLNPEFLEVFNESHMHRTAPGAESHFKVVVVSALFAGERLLARHRRINTLLAEELAGTLHALALHTYTPQEWQERTGAPRTPGCIGNTTL